MSKIFELYGYPLENWNQEAEANRAMARCPFMNKECDGGGNRYLSGIKLDNHPKLKPYFPNKELIQSGVCSLRPRENEQPWIVCPRRLLSLKGEAKQQGTTLQTLLKVAELPSGSFRAWSEVKMMVKTTNEDDESKSFDYTFDYIISGSIRIPISQAAQFIELKEAKVKKIAEDNGFTLALRNGVLWIDDFPSDPIVIVEIMTSSTSGGNKNKRTQIAMAFEDAVLNGNNHTGPGINYRQVWARMVSQLIVKSQVGTAWKGKTIWLLQDVLANYISKSTGLNLEKYLNQHPDEVNILAFGYGEKSNKTAHKGNLIELTDSKFYAGPISNSTELDNGFIDIVKIGAAPPKEKLWRALFLKQSCAMLKT